MICRWHGGHHYADHVLAHRCHASKHNLVRLQSGPLRATGLVNKAVVIRNGDKCRLGLFEPAVNGCRTPALIGQCDFHILAKRIRPVHWVTPSWVGDLLIGRREASLVRHVEGLGGVSGGWKWPVASRSQLDTVTVRMGAVVHEPNLVFFIKQEDGFLNFIELINRHRLAEAVRRLRRD